MCKARLPDVLIIATKPQYVELALADAAMIALQGKGLGNTLFVSIAAGKTTDHLIRALNGDDSRNLRGARVIRVMPNTPCMVGEAASALCRGMSSFGGSHMLLLCSSSWPARSMSLLALTQRCLCLCVCGSVQAKASL
jgi:hypothetical protein